MIFFLLFYFFPSIGGDCLEFVNSSLINKCLIVDSELPPDGDIDHYYPHCLQCNIETKIESKDIQLENENPCLTIELQCVQLKFPTREIFEDFFQIHQSLLYDLFSKINGTDQNTLHIIIKKNTLKEINIDYIERIFQLEDRVYRALLLELHVQKDIIQINRNLVDLAPLSIKIILVCGEKFERKATIYVIHEQNITLESKYDPCAPIFIPSFISTTSPPSEVISITQEKSKNIVLIIILLTAFLLFLCISSTIYCLKRIKRHYRRLSKNLDSTSELSVSQDETPVTPSVQPKLSLKLKRPVRGVRALQLLDDDV